MAASAIVCAVPVRTRDVPDGGHVLLARGRACRGSHPRLPQPAIRICRARVWRTRTAGMPPGPDTEAMPARPSRVAEAAHFSELPWPLVSPVSPASQVSPVSRMLPVPSDSAALTEVEVLRLTPDLPWATDSAPGKPALSSSVGSHTPKERHDRSLWQLLLEASFLVRSASRRWVNSDLLSDHSVVEHNCSLQEQGGPVCDPKEKSSQGYLSGQPLSALLAVCAVLTAVALPLSPSQAMQARYPAPSEPPAAAAAAYTPLGKGEEFAPAAGPVDPSAFWRIASNGAVESAEELEEAGPVGPEELVLEAWGVVKDTFLDARNAGWTEEKWEAAKSLALKRGIRSLPEARSVVSTMIAGLRDPFSRYLTPDQFARLAKYDITGVGLNIGDLAGPRAERRPVVVGIVLESPAFKAGIRQGDELVAVDGQDVSRMSSFDVASLIQGARDTPVMIAISRPNGKPAPGQNCTETGLCSFKVVRSSEAPATPVTYRLERHRPTLLRGSEDDPEAVVLSGYIRVREFNAVAKRDLAEAVRRLQEAGAQSLVLDLQDNPGGLVQAGVESAKLFLKEGQTVVYTRARGGAASERGVVASRPPLTDIPLTVLVNGRTASASEIVAAALHDNCRAVLVGSTTYGKGLIQSVYELQDGSGLILTVGKYVTPAHQDIDGNGIKPDFRRSPGRDVAQHRLQTCRQVAQLK